MVTPTQNRAIVRASAGYDLLTCIGFVTPWTLGPTLALIFGASSLVGLPAAAATFGPVQMLFANLMGSAVLVWSLARLYYPTQAMGRFDALSRGLFLIWEVWAFTQGASPAILAFAFAEVGFGIAELLPVSAEEAASDLRDASRSWRF